MKTNFSGRFLGIFFLTVFVSSTIASAADVYDFSDVAKKPALRDRGEWPMVPASVIKKGKADKVVIEFIVNTRGRVDNVKTISAPDAAWGKNCIKAVSKRAYAPAEINDKKVSCRMQETFTFDPALVDPKVVFELGDVDKIPSPKGQRRTPPPNFPWEKVKGKGPFSATVMFVVDVDGKPKDIRINAIKELSKWGNECGAVVSTWRYSPAIKNGVPVKCHMQIPFSVSRDDS